MGSRMGTIDTSRGQEGAQVRPVQDTAPDGGDVLKRLDLPEEVSTQQAAAILGCCKHTVLQYLEDGLLEWRNAAPPSSNRPVFRLTLRSVLELRLTYQRGSPRPPQPAERSKGRQRRPPPSGFTPKHLRRKNARPPGGGSAPDA
jgi:hypothetical protein